VLLTLLLLLLVDVDLFEAGGEVSEKAHEQTRTTVSPNTLFPHAPRTFIPTFTLNIQSLPKCPSNQHAGFPPNDVKESSPTGADTEIIPESGSQCQ